MVLFLIGIMKQAEQMNEIIQLQQFIEDDERISNRNSRVVGIGMIAGAAAVGLSLMSGDLSHLAVSHSMPFIETVQKTINGVDGDLALFGEVAFPITLGTIGFSKFFSRNSRRLQYMDEISSKEMSNEGKNKNHPLRRFLERTFAGKVAVLAAVGVALGSFSSSVGNEVSNGPQRPIVQALNKLAPGDALIVQDSAEEPMLDGQISNQLTTSIMNNAKSSGITASILTKNLGNITVPNSGKSYSTLEFGTEIANSSDIFWSVSSSCNNIPIEVDNSSSIKKGTEVKIDGVNARVVNTLDGFSAIGRIGVVMSEEAMRTCIQKDENAPVYGVVINGSVEEARKVLNSSNLSGESATVISKEQYIQNSFNFWESNVKPITNTMAVFSGLFAFMAMSGAMTSRMIRNRREIAAMSASGVKSSVIKGAEIMRAAKDSVVATTVGWSIALLTPFIVNTTELGFKASIGIKDLGVGAAIGVIGCVGGVLNGLRKSSKLLDVNENTRVS